MCEENMPKKGRFKILWTLFKGGRFGNVPVKRHSGLQAKQPSIKYYCQKILRAMIDSRLKKHPCDRKATSGNL